MAQSTRLGGVLLQGFSRALKGQVLHGAPPFSYIVSRAMSRLFVGGLSFRTEEDGLRNAFAAHGEVIDARIITDRETGRSRGFGFVTYLSEADAETAIGKMDGQFLDGRVIRVNKASPRPAPPRLNPDMDSSAPPAVEDWGAIPTSNAAVPQNAGLSADVGSPQSIGLDSSPTTSPSSNSTFDLGLSDLRETKTRTKDTGPSFDFIDLDLSNLPPPDPNRLPRRPPRPRIRPSSMSDYDYSFPMSESSRFPYNSNFDTGVPKPTGPEFDFEFPEFPEPPIQPYVHPTPVTTETSSATAEASSVSRETSSVSTEVSAVTAEASSASTEASAATAEASAVTAEASSESIEPSSVNTDPISASST